MCVRTVLCGIRRGQLAARRTAGTNDRCCVRECLSHGIQLLLVGREPEELIFLYGSTQCSTPLFQGNWGEGALVVHRVQTAAIDRRIEIVSGIETRAAPKCEGRTADRVGSR